MEKEVYLKQLDVGVPFRWQGLNWVVIDKNGLSSTCMIIDSLPRFKSISLKFPLGSKRNFFRRMLYGFFCESLSDMEGYILMSRVDIKNLNIYDRLVILSPEEFEKYKEIILPYLSEGEKVWTCQEESDKYTVLKKESKYFTPSIENEDTRANIYPVARLGAIKVTINSETESLMTPDTFREVSKFFLKEKLTAEDELQAINLMTDILEKLGYEEGVDILKYAFNWK